MSLLYGLAKVTIKVPTNPHQARQFRSRVMAESRHQFGKWPLIGVVCLNVFACNVRSANAQFAGRMLGVQIFRGADNLFNLIEGDVFKHLYAPSLKWAADWRGGLSEIGQDRQCDIKFLVRKCASTAESRLLVSYSAASRSTLPLRCAGERLCSGRRGKKSVRSVGVFLGSAMALTQANIASHDAAPA